MTTTAKITPSRHLSPIWILPFVALLIAIWLVYKSMSEAGIIVKMTFQDAQGIEAGKTQVIYRGLSIGVVRKLQIQPDFNSVVATVEFDRNAKDQLREKSQFWMVKPELSASGIRGLDTIIKGNYIAMKPGNGQPKFEFIALTDQPFENADKIGLYLKLISDQPTSIARGNKVYYRQIEAGEVQEVSLNDKDQIIIRIRIKPKFVKKVKTSSRFYQLSSVSLEGGLDGISLKTAPFGALLSGGGISFVTPDLNAPSVRLEHEFKLYPSEKKAAKSTTLVKKAGLYFSLLSKTVGALKEGSKVYYQQIPIGEVINLGLTEQDQIKLDIFIEAEFEEKVNQSSLFYPLPRFNLEAGLDGLSFQAGSLSTIVNGGIAIQTLNKKAQPIQEGQIRPLYKDEKTALGKAKSHSNTAQFTLLADDASALKIGSGVFFRGLEAGKVTQVKLLDNDQMQIRLHLTQSFARRVNQSSQFYLQDGINFEGGLDGIKLNTGSLATLLKSGIAFNTPNKKAAKVPKHHRFKLYQNKSNAELAHKDQLPGLYIELETDDPGSIVKGNKVYYKHIEVGEVIKIAFAKQDKIRISVRIDSKYRNKVRNNAHFYKAGGVTLQGGLRGFEIKAESFSSIVKGGIAFIIPKKGAPKARKGQVFTLYKDQNSATKLGTNIYLKAANAEDLNKNSQIKYLGLTIGEITEIKMKPSENKVIFKARIEQKYRHLMREKTRFWVVKPEVSLSGIKNLGSIVSGTYIQIQPGNGRFQNQFTILAKAPLAITQQRHQNEALEIVLETSRLGTIQVDAPVMYRDIKVGSVVSVGLAEDATKVHIKVVIQPEYNTLVRTDSKFWRTSGISLDAGLFSGFSLNFGGFESLIQGGISFATPGKGQQEEIAEENQDANDFNEEAPLFERVKNKFISQPPASEVATQGLHFDLADKAEEEWLEWKAEIK